MISGHPNLKDDDRDSIPQTRHTRRPRLPRIQVGLVVTLVTLFLFGLLAEDVFEQEAIRFDQEANDFLHEFSSVPMNRAMELCSALGSWPVISVLVVVCSIWLYRSRAHYLSLFLIIATVGGSFLNYGLKLAFQRPRPELHWSTPPSTFSFPSGHAMNSLVFYLAAAIVVWALWGRKWGIAATVLASLLALLIGMSRIYLGYHYFSDVVGGYAAGLAWLAAVALVFEARGRLEPSGKLPPSGEDKEEF